MDEKTLLFLDSTYLLPIFGVKLEYRNFDSIFAELLEKFEVRYNPVSLIEIKWSVLGMSKKKSAGDDNAALFQSYRTGLAALQRDPRIQSTILTNEKIEEISDRLTHTIPDYFDRLIYSTAAHFRGNLLSEDSHLGGVFRKTVDEDVPRPATIMKWKELHERARSA
jgi:hypothetical protein